jgi:hypothetical protein
MDAARFLDPVNVRDIRMIECRQHLRFAPESRQPVRILSQSGRKNLDGDFAVELDVARGVHLVHATRAEGREDFVVTELVAHGKRYLQDSVKFGRSEGGLLLNYGVS